MKYNNDIEKSINIEQIRGGYVLTGIGLGSMRRSCFDSFEKAVSEIAFEFGVIEIGERIVLSSTTERQEGAREQAK